MNLRRFLSLLISLPLFVFVFLYTSAVTSAQTVNNFTVESFHGRYELFNDVSGGRMKVTERIDVVFSAQNHGILRALPNKYKKQKLNIEIHDVQRDGINEQYSSYKENGNVVIKIGDPATTITGKHSYVINYEMSNVVGFYDSHDEWYWDINGDDWSQPFLAVTGEVIFPDDWTEEGVPAAVCYTGSFGSSKQSCEVNKTQNGYTFNTTDTLFPTETLTIISAIPKGVFQPRTFRDTLKDYWPLIAGTIVPPLFIGGWAYRKWARDGKDLKGRETIIPEYDAPKDLSPAEAAVVSNFGLSGRDVSATIIDLAVRKYVRIHEVTQKKLLKDKKGYELELLNVDWSALKAHESKILTGIFTDVTANKHVTIESLKNKFYVTVQNLQSSLPKELAADGYFTGNPRTVGLPMYIFGIALIIIGFVLLLVMPGMIIAGIIVLIFASYMPKRTKQGVSVKEHMEGLKLYMNTAEKDRIKMLQSPDAPYAGRGSDPKKTVELFEKLLPYAIILGVERGWADQFKNIYKTPPDWYTGDNWTAFNTGVLVGSLNNTLSAMNTSFSAPSSSNGSGFSGGGFSGGGGGGGGGGGW